MYQQLSVLGNLTEGFVHRIGPEQLCKDLPPKHEHVVLLCLDTAQQAMYKAYLEVWPETQDEFETKQLFLYAVIRCCAEQTAGLGCFQVVQGPKS